MKIFKHGTTAKNDAIEDADEHIFVCYFCHCVFTANKNEYKSREVSYDSEGNKTYYRFSFCPECNHVAREFEGGYIL